jgi:hypothetical protein
MENHSVCFLPHGYVPAWFRIVCWQRMIKIRAIRTPTPKRQNQFLRKLLPLRLLRTSANLALV